MSTLEVIGDFYEFKDCILESLVQIFTKKFDRCFKNFHQSLVLSSKSVDNEADNQNEQAKNDDNNENQKTNNESSQKDKTNNSNSLERYELIRQQTISDFTDYLDGFLSNILNEFFSDENTMKQISYVANSNLNTDLASRFSELLKPIKEDFSIKLNDLCQTVKENLQDKEEHLKTTNEELRINSSKYNLNHHHLIKKLRSLVTSLDQIDFIRN